MGVQGDDGFASVLEHHDPVDSARRMMGFAQVRGGDSFLLAGLLAVGKQQPLLAVAVFIAYTQRAKGGAQMQARTAVSVDDSFALPALRNTLGCWVF